MRTLTDRTLLFDTAVVNNNREFDYLSYTIDFNKFKTPDREFVVKLYHIGRLDLISYEVYQSPYYWWLIAARNDIIDPFTELEVGDILLIPSIYDYFDMYNKEVKVKGDDGLKFDKRTI